MEIKKDLKLERKADKTILQSAISTLKNSLTTYKTQRKSEWKIFKSKFKVELHAVERLLEKMKVPHKS
jgi:uncharacterized protein YicC (UPF0701 family)